MSYTLELTDKVSKLDEIVEANGARCVVPRAPLTFAVGAKIAIDNKALLSVFGTKMDYVTEGDLKSEFIFVNPNAKSTCGCGESFNI